MSYEIEILSQKTVFFLYKFIPTEFPFCIKRIPSYYIESPLKEPKCPNSGRLLTESYMECVVGSKGQIKVWCHSRISNLIRKDIHGKCGRKLELENKFVRIFAFFDFLTVFEPSSEEQSYEVLMYILTTTILM